MMGSKETKCHMTIGLMNLLNIPTSMSLHHKYILWPPLAARRPWHAVITLLGRIAAHAWRTARHNSGTMERGHPCLGSRAPFGPMHAQWVYVCTPGSAVHELHILFCQKYSRATYYVWCGIVPGHKQSFVQTRRSPREVYYHTQKPHGG